VAQVGQLQDITGAQYGAAFQSGKDRAEALAVAARVADDELTLGLPYQGVQ
jgi:hypothetical protein